MRRRFAALIVGALLISLVGCQYANPTLHAPLSMTPGQNYTDYSGMEIRIGSMNWHEEEGKTTLVVVWDNDTSYDVIYGAAYAIERLDGEEWVSCAMRDELAFIAIGYELKAGRMRNESYDLTRIYDVSSPGTYRFRTDCSVYESDGKSVKCELVAEFTVGDIE